MPENGAPAPTTSLERYPPARRRVLVVRPRGVAWLYAGALLLACLAALVRTPITAIDNDLWYHLSHGREIVETGAIPEESYFSFRDPPRRWVDYYWGFQVLVYGVYEVAGYGGLIALRAALFAVFFVGVAVYLLRGARSKRRLVWLALVLGLIACHSLHKYLMVRPHTLSYLMIPLFLLLLESRSRAVLLLPVLALAWTNVHGVEYPVMLLILGAYAAEHVWRRLRGTGDADPRKLLAIALACAAVFLTPHGTRLLAVPFTSTEYASVYLNELSRVEWRHFLTFELAPESFTNATAFNVLLVAAVVAAAVGVLRRRARLSALALLGGALVLLTKAIRFTHEASVLLLPLLKSRSLVPAGGTAGRPRLVSIVLAAALLLTPFVYLAQRLPEPAATWPLALRDLPHGIAAFLARVPGEGAVMNNPNVGGYLQWALPPRYRIFMDLEIPFLFTDEDMYELASAFFDPHALRRFLDRYRPPFIAAPIAAGGFPGLIAAHPRYVPVFFDDTGVVYVDRERFPAIAETHRLVHVDPWALARVRFSELPPERLAGIRAELERVLAIDPAISSASQSMAILHNLSGEHDRALARIDAVIAKEPALARAWAIKADALAASGEPERAAELYARALERSRDEQERRRLERSRARALERAGRPGEAFAALRRAVGTFNVEASFDDLYRLGVLAAASGDARAARKMLTFAALKVAPEDVERQRLVAEALAALGPGADVE